MSVQATSSYRTVHKHITNLDLPGPVFASAVSTAVQPASSRSIGREPRLTPKSMRRRCLGLIRPYLDETAHLGSLETWSDMHIAVLSIHL
jgi:hypothetical protein